MKASIQYTVGLIVFCALIVVGAGCIPVEPSSGNRVDSAPVVTPIVVPVEESVNEQVTTQEDESEDVIDIEVEQPVHVEPISNPVVIEEPRLTVTEPVVDVEDVRDETVDTHVAVVPEQKKKKKEEEKKTPPTIAEEYINVEEPQMIQVQIDVVDLNNNLSYTFDVEKGMTVEQAMQSAVTEGFQYTTKGFGALGTYVDSINGLSEDISGHMYWIYYVNHAKSVVGISSRRLEDGDVVMWNYEKGI